MSDTEEYEINDFEEVEVGIPTRQDNSVIRQMRQAQREAAQRSKKLAAENELLKKELAEQVTLNQKAAVFALFSQAGVDRVFAEDCWNAGARTEEQAIEWGTKRGLLQVADAQPDMLAPQPRQSFVPAGSNTGIASTGVKLSMDEYREMAKLQPGKAQQLWDQGMVKGSDDFMVDSDGAVTAKKVPY